MPLQWHRSRHLLLVSRDQPATLEHETEPEEMVDPEDKLGVV